MKLKLKYEFRFIILLASIFVLVIISASFVYRKLAKTIDNISFQLKPDEQILIMKSIKNDLIDAENKIYSFNLTKDYAYRASFYKIVFESEKKLRRLKNNSSEDKSFKTQIVLLEKLVLQKYQIVDSIAQIQNQYRVNDVLNKVEEQIQVINPVKAVPKPKEIEDKSWKDVFKKRKTSKEEKKLDNIEKDKLLNFKKEIGEFKEIEVNKELNNNKLELGLIQQDKIVMSKIDQLFLLLEKTERKSIAKKTQIAKANATDAKYFLIAFSLLSTILLVLTSYSIVQYIRRNNEYKIMLQKAKKDSDDLAESKMRFLSNMSHEIRTPLNSIIGFARQLAGSETISKNQGEKEQLGIIQHAANHLLSLINQILDFSKLQANKVELVMNPFNPKIELENLVMIIEPNVQEKENRIFFRIVDKLPENILGDEVKFKQILLNLLSNAIKFTQKGRIDLIVKASKPQGEKIVLEIQVIDTGIGMEKESLSKIFEEFEQENNSTSKNYGGTGLGLSITKMLVELHGGSITVTSKKNSGTCFTVFLPYEITDKKSPVTDDKKSLREVKGINTPINLVQFLKGKKVLVVDDEPYNRKLLVSILSKNKAHIQEAENGQMALNYFDKNWFDYILMDLRMPVMNGVEASKVMRNSSNLDKRKIPIIALTADNSENVQNQAAMFDGILIKPFHEADLFNIMQKFNNSNEIFLNSTETNSEKTVIQQKYNLQALRDISNGNNDFFTDMIETFIRTTKSGLFELEECVKQNDLKTIKKIAHRIISPCKHIGAKDLSEMLAKIEHYDETLMNLEDIKKIVSTIRIEADEIIERLEKEI
ncbi:MAG: ATP-binding protein [Bacteroidota bacterium]